MSSSFLHLHALDEHSHFIYPILGTLVYSSIVPQFHHAELSPGALKALALIHNALLCIFSAYTFFSLVQILQERGVVFQSGYYFQEERFDRLVMLFYFSKYYEYIDTILLHLKKRTPPFLQVFHHLGAVGCWHVCYIYKVDAIMWATLCNGCVHTVMYAYYFLSLFQLSVLKRCKPIITIMQIVQLVGANVLSPVAYFPPVESAFKYSLIVGFNIYVVILVFLFARFANETYVLERSTKAEKGQ